MRFTFHSHCAPGNEKPGHDPTSGRPLRAPAWLLRRCPRRRARCRACGATAAVPRCHRHANAREEEHETATKAAAWAAVWVAAAAVVLARVLGLSSGGAGGSSCALRNPQVGDLRAPLVPPGGSAAGRVQCEARWALRRRGRRGGCGEEELVALVPAAGCPLPLQPRSHAAAATAIAIATLFFFSDGGGNSRTSARGGSGGVRCGARSGPDAWRGVEQSRDTPRIRGRTRAPRSCEHEGAAQ